MSAPETTLRNCVYSVPQSEMLALLKKAITSIAAHRNI